MTTMTATATTTTTRGAGPAARFAGWAGIGFAATCIAGFVLVAQVPTYDASDADWVAWVENDNVPTVIGALVGGAMPAGVTFAPDFEAPGGELIRSLDQLSLGLVLVGTGWSMAVTVALASWAGRRSARLPAWLTTAGLVVAVLLLLSPMFLPIVLVPLWVLTTGIIVLRSGGTARSGTASYHPGSRQRRG